MVQRGDRCVRAREREDNRTKHIPLRMLTSVNAASEAKGFLARLSERDRDEI